MVQLVRHRCTKGAVTDRQNLTPPRHIPTLPFREVNPCFSLWLRMTSQILTCFLISTGVRLFKQSLRRVITFFKAPDYYISRGAPHSPGNVAGHQPLQHCLARFGMVAAVMPGGKNSAIWTHAIWK
jgi:hypothetical protein